MFSSWAGGGLTWTEFADLGGTTANMSIGAAYTRAVTGSETGAVTVTQATVNGHASMILLSIPGAHTTTAPEAAPIVHYTTAAADPAAFDPAGWAAEDTLWIAVGGSGETAITGTWDGMSTAAPANYTDRVDTNTPDSSVVGQAEAAVAFRQLNAASENVGTWTPDLSNVRNSATLIAVRPAASTASPRWKWTATQPQLR